MDRSSRRLSCLALLLAAPPVWAAGGHHAIDDAALLEPGQCQLESWVDSGRRDGFLLSHAGAACRVGPFELGLNLDRARDTAGVVRSGGPQLKWAAPLAPGLSVGLVAGSTWQDTAPRYAGGTLVLPLTWQATGALAVHLNLGRDFLRGAPDLPRGGAALEWTVTPTWSLVAERYLEARVHFARAGLRYAASPALSIDLSRSHGLGGQAAGRWTLGLSLLGGP